MSFGGTLRRFGYYLRDVCVNPRGTRIHEQWNNIKRIQSNFETGWPQVQSSLEQCLSYATQYSDFYKEYTGKPLHHFPVMNKLRFLEYYDQIKTRNFEDNQLHKSSTSGSTGTPFTVLQNKGKRNRVLAELQYWGECVGYHSHEKMIFFRAKPHVSFWSMFWANVWQYDITKLSLERMNSLYGLQSKHPQALIAYASTFDTLTAFWLNEGKQGSPSVKSVFTGSETLTLTTRKRIEQFWPNAKAYSRYSNMENGMLAQECGELGVFEICWASYYIEVLKFDSDEPASEGELGRIVVTDLYNKAFPMIRYDTGDAGCLERGPTGWPRLTKLFGRRVDLIYDTNGEVCSPFLLTKTLKGADAVLQYQFIQTGEKTYTLTYVTQNDDQAKSELLIRILELKKYLGVNAEIDIQRVNEMPVLSSGKRKCVVQMWKKTT